MSIPVFRPLIRRKEMHSVLSCMVSDVIGPAVIVEDLTAQVAAEFSFDGGTALREYVRAVTLVIRSLNMEKGDKAVISPLAPAAYALAFKQCGIIPVFADVKKSDATLDPDSVIDLSDSSVKAVFIHAPLGRVPDISALSSISVPMVIDIGQALGARTEKGLLGSRADYLIISMESDGIVTCGGGTLVLASDVSRLKSLKNEIKELSPDAFLPDLNASLGLVQWRDYPGALESRMQLYDLFLKALSGTRHNVLVSPEEPALAVPYSFPVVLTSPMNEVRRYAQKKGVETLPAFSSTIINYYPGTEDKCPSARSLFMNVLLFPLYPSLGKKNIQLIAKVLSTLP